MLPQYQVPTAPTPNPTGSALPYIGPYKQQQAQAQAAYEAAMSNIASQRAQTYQQYGFMPGANGGPMRLDPSNPFGQMQQTMLTNEQEADQIANAQRARGFAGPGLGHQAINAGRTAEQGRLASVSQALAAALSGYSQQGQQAQFDLNNADLQAQLNSVQYAIDNHLFANGNPMLDQSVVDQRVKQMAKAFAKRFGAAGTNKAGETFQQRLDRLGATALYDPNAHYGIAGVKY